MRSLRYTNPSLCSRFIPISYSFNEFFLFRFSSPLGVCNHNTCCALCMYRLRKFFNIKQCLLCDQELPTIIFTDKPCQFADIQTESIPDRYHDQSISAYFQDLPFFETVQELTQTRCIICDQVFSNPAELQTHVTQAHKRSFWFIYYYFIITTVFFSIL